MLLAFTQKLHRVGDEIPSFQVVVHYGIVSFRLYVASLSEAMHELVEMRSCAFAPSVQCVTLFSVRHHLGKGVLYGCSAVVS